MCCAGLTWKPLITIDHLFTARVFAKFILVMTVEGVQSTKLGVGVNSDWDRWTG